jgi:hypothetical protein
MRDKYFVDATVVMNAHDITAGAEHDRMKVLVEQVWPSRRYTTGCTGLGGGPEALSILRSWGGRSGPQTSDGNRRALKAAANIP